MKTVLLAALLLVACGERDAGNTEPAAGAFDELTSTLDEAAAVEAQLEAHKQRLDEAIQDAEQDAPPQRR